MPERPDVLFPAEPWTVSETAFSPDTNYRNETTFALSNGYIGTRGTQDECMPFDVGTGLEGNYINGFYESETVRYGEWNFGFPTQSQSLLNLPNPKQIVPIVDGEKLDLRTASLHDYRRQLDMREGVLKRSFIWITQQGKQIEVRSERFCSLDNQNLLAMRYEMIPLNFSGEITLCSALEADVENHTRKTNPLIDYGPFGRRIEPESMTAEPFRLFYQGVTQHTKLHMACGVDHQVQGKVVAQTHKAEEMRGELTFVLSAVQGETIRLIKLIAFASSASAGQLRPFVWNCLDDCACTGYEALRRAHVAHMRQFWDTADVEIDGDEWVQQGIRFNLFHIMQASGRNGRTGLGAKGLTGEGYEGHYFWDTETYIMPVFDYTQPMLSRNLLLYRYHTLPQARERAKVLGHPCGALYPWRTINGEEASTYFPLGTAQYHI
ncbi:MAG: glycoside hydrolase family 65 protein, partial [Clostridia bacterium]